MQLRRFLTGLTAAAAVALISISAGATTRIAAPGFDYVVGGAGVNALICSGKVVSQAATTVSFPNGTRTLPAIEYTIDCSKILKGNKDYPASETPATIKVKMYAGEMKDFPRPVVGEEGLHIFYGKSVVGLQSYAFGNQGFWIYKDVDGRKVAVSSAGKGLFFKNTAIRDKFMKVNPNASKFLRKGPIVDEGFDTPELASQEDLTPEVLEQAVRTVLSVEGR
jgi:hypothetical protein